MLLVADLPLVVRFGEYVKRVQPVALFGSAGWTWSKQVFFLLYRWENTWLRRMVNLRRQPGEDFVAHIRRATGAARTLFHKYGHLSLCTQALMRMHRLAGHAYQQMSGPSSDTPLLSMAFLGACLTWRDREWWGLQQAIGTTTYLDPAMKELPWRHHKPGRQLQFEDIFVHVYGPRWKDGASQPDWNKSEFHFVNSAYEHIKAKPLEQRFVKKSAKKDSVVAVLCFKKPRTVERPIVLWRAGGGHRVEFVGDSLLVINWMRGLWEIKYQRYYSRVCEMLSWCEKLSRTSKATPPDDHLDFHRHIFGEINADADSKANLGRMSGACSWHSDFNPVDYCCLRLYFDGSYKDGACGAGFVLFASSDPGPQDDRWEMAAWMCFTVFADSITAAELEAAAAAHAFVVQLLCNSHEWHTFFESYKPWSYIE